MALSTCLNICDCVGSKADLPKLVGVLPFLSICLSNDDEHIASKASLCFSKIIEKFSKNKRTAPNLKALHIPKDLSIPGKKDDQKGREEEVDDTWRHAFLKEVAQTGLLAHWLKLNPGE